MYLYGPLWTSMYLYVPTRRREGFFDSFQLRRPGSSTTGGRSGSDHPTGSMFPPERVLLTYPLTLYASVPLFTTYTYTYPRTLDY